MFLLCVMNILGNVGAILGQSLDDFGVSLVCLRQRLAMLGPSWGFLLGSWGLLGFTLGLSWVMLGLCRGYLGASWGFVINLFTKHKKHIPHANAKSALARPLSSDNAPSQNPTPKRVHET